MRERAETAGSVKTGGENAAGVRIVAIGVSTGGPAVLECILSRLPPLFPAPILIVQHIAEGFTEGLAEWLDQKCALSVRIAAHGDVVRPGAVSMAPGGRDMVVGSGGRLDLCEPESEGGPCPSIDRLFGSVTDIYGYKAVGILLTGMGRDGSRELKRMRERGAVTIAQDGESSVVNGMPAEAIRIDAAMHVLDPEGIAAMLIKLAGCEGMHR
jgi:two-component system chemotaxis response regulator CheB